jgi:hypothetical protein
MSSINHLTRWIIGAVTGVAVVVVLAVALWPQSAEDRAYDDGQRLGQALTDLRTADTYAEVDAGLTDVRHAASKAHDHVGDALDEQLTKQQNAFFAAVDGYAGATTTDDAWEQDVYDAELDDALNAFDDQADDFRSSSDDVARAFGDGLQSGLQS